MTTQRPNVQIRPARPEDRDAVMRLVSRLAGGVAEWRDPEAVVEAARQWLAGYFVPERKQPGAVFVAVTAAQARDGEVSGGEFSDGEVVGVVSVNTHRHFTGPMEAYVGELAVAPHAVRMGLGRRLLSAAEDWARGQGVRHLTLETAAGNTTARRFYTAMGYGEEAVRFTRVLD
ncbi:GNAT family N-acetyltransferase [Nonomuraea sp. FMUSA5-5]|uniref:GNAT family N-acetyltransferase n=1 Tax=Nonomuraea composti TaxID=2720023 RepID=A0ABX1BDN2_9ACTN|nr:GNAT family N-acetyltransferase [Nonomuraea sp. FMUSA5-5]NJP94514.1 GNAT family N-acetyltransferase [Nonomuraea sp. FMUSA5-5]